MSVIFDQLRISDNAKKLYINVHINEADYFNNLYLDSIVITNTEYVSETNPDLPTENYLWKKDLTNNNYREVHIVLEPTDFNERFNKDKFTDELLFVYVKVRGVPDVCTPCRLDEEITLGVTFDVNMLYQIVMQQTRQLVDKCDIPRDFLDLILLWNGFKAAIETEHYIVAIDFWKKIFRSKNSAISLIKGCGCHG